MDSMQHNQNQPTTRRSQAQHQRHCSTRSTHRGSCPPATTRGSFYILSATLRHADPPSILSRCRHHPDPKSARPLQSSLKFDSWSDILSTPARRTTPAYSRSTTLDRVDNDPAHAVTLLLDSHPSQRPPANPICD